VSLRGCRGMCVDGSSRNKCERSMIIEEWAKRRTQKNIAFTLVGRADESRGVLPERNPCSLRFSLHSAGRPIGSSIGSEGSACG